MSVSSQNKCNIYSITSKLTIDLTLNYVKIFEFQNGSTRKLGREKQTHFRLSLLSIFRRERSDLQTKFIVTSVRPRVLKSPQSRSLHVCS